MEVTPELAPLFLKLFGAAHIAGTQGAFDAAALALQEEGNEEAVKLLWGIRDAQVAIIDEYMGFNSTEEILNGGPVFRPGREPKRPKPYNP